MEYAVCKSEIGGGLAGNACHKVVFGFFYHTGDHVEAGRSVQWTSSPAERFVHQRHSPPNSWHPDSPYGAWPTYLFVQSTPSWADGALEGSLSIPAPAAKLRTFCHPSTLIVPQAGMARATIAWEPSPRRTPILPRRSHSTIPSSTMSLCSSMGKTLGWCAAALRLWRCGTWATLPRGWCRTSTR